MTRTERLEKQLLNKDKRIAVLESMLKSQKENKVSQAEYNKLDRKYRDLWLVHAKVLERNVDMEDRMIELYNENTQLKQRLNQPVHNSQKRKLSMV